MQQQMQFSLDYLQKSMTDQKKSVWFLLLKFINNLLD